MSRPRFIRIPFDWMGPYTFPNTARARRFLWAVVGLTALAARGRLAAARGSAVAPGAVGARVALAGAALAPIALHQAGGKSNDWIASFGMAGRLRETGISFFVGEAGLLKHALIPFALFALALALLLARGGAREKRGGDEPLAFYLGGGETRVKWKQWRLAPRAVSEVDVVSGRPPPPGARSALPPSFRRVQQVSLGRMTLIRYRAARPHRIGWGRLVGNFTGYSNNAVLLDSPQSP